MTTETSDDRTLGGPVGDPVGGPLRHVGVGLAMGGADVIPGVSGGTMALLLGIYPRLVASIAALAGAAGNLLRGRTSAAGEGWRKVEWSFVLPLGAGVLLALGLGAAILPDLLEQYPVQMNALFFGLIVASLAVPWALTGSGSRRVWVAGAFAVLAFALMGLSELVVETVPLWRVAISAAVAICAMILPGVSGAFLLLVLGVYEPTLEAAAQADVVYLGVFALGAIVGLAFFSRLLGWLLETREEMTMAALVGLMIGSLRRLWPWGGEEGAFHAPEAAGEAAMALALALIGFAVVRVLIVMGRRRDLGEAAATSELGS